MWILIILLFLTFTVISGTLTTFPFVLVLLLNFAVITKKSWIFAASFLTGLFLDIFSFNALGRTSLFFLLFIFIVILYDKKFEIQTYPFVFISSFLGSLVYLIMLVYPSVFIQSLCASVVAVLFFFLLKRFLPKERDLLSEVRTI